MKKLAQRTIAKTFVRMNLTSYGKVTYVILLLIHEELNQMNTKLLKSIMVLNDDNLMTLATYLGVSRQTLSLKVDGISDFRLNEVRMIRDKYKLSDSETIEIFFGGHYESKRCC